MYYTLLKSNNKIPNFGIGTWGLGENESKKEKEIKVYNICFTEWRKIDRYS